MSKTQNLELNLMNEDYYFKGKKNKNVNMLVLLLFIMANIYAIIIYLTLKYYGI
jgi:hypothetical protein